MKKVKRKNREGNKKSKKIGLGAKFNACMAHRSILIKGEQDASQTFDKVLITITTGILYLSVFSLRNFHSKPEHLWLLIVGLALSAFVIILSFISFYCSEIAFRKETDGWDKETENILYDEKNKVSSNNKLVKFIKILKLSLLLSVISSVVFILLFYILNLNNLYPND